MARNSTVVQIDTRVLDDLIKHLDGNVAEAIAKTAFGVEARAKLKAPVDTGALRASHYTSLKDSHSTRFATARQDAIGRRPDAVLEPLPIPKNDHEAYVGPSVDYAEEVHNGTTSKVGRPFLLQAARETESDLREFLKKAVTPK